MQGRARFEASALTTRALESGEALDRDLRCAGHEPQHSSTCKDARASGLSIVAIGRLRGAGAPPKPRTHAARRPTLR